MTNKIQQYYDPSVRYHLVFENNKSYTGTAEEIAQQLRDTSLFEEDLKIRDYLKNFAKRHNQFLHPKVIAADVTAFLLTLASSPIIKHLYVLRDHDDADV